MLCLCSTEGVVNRGPSGEYTLYSIDLVLYVNESKLSCCKLLYVKAKNASFSFEKIFHRTAPDLIGSATSMSFHQLTPLSWISIPESLVENNLPITNSQKLQFANFEFKSSKKIQFNVSSP